MNSLFWKCAILILFTPLLYSAGTDWSDEIPEGFRASVHISKTTVTVEESLVVSLALHYPSTYQPDVDTIRKNLLNYIGVTEPPFALIRESIRSPSDNQTHLTFFLEPQIPGTHYLSFYQIPFLPLEKEGNEKKYIISEIFEITVNLADVPASFKGNPVGLLSIARPLPLQINRENLARISLPEEIDQEFKRSKAIVNSRAFPFTQILGIIFFCVVALIIRMQPEKRLDKRKETQKRAADAKSKALDALRALNPANKEEYYNQITDIVRTYIEEKYQLKSTKQTTEEFLLSMAAHQQFDDETRAKLSDFLLNADRVKFANHAPSDNECLKAKKTAERFVNFSIPK